MAGYVDDFPTGIGCVDTNGVTAKQGTTIDVISIKMIRKGY
jgi:hypothetical protein